MEPALIGSSQKYVDIVKLAVEMWMIFGMFLLR